MNDLVGIVLPALQMLSHLALKRAVGVGIITEAPRGSVTCSRSYTQPVRGEARIQT